MLAAMAELDAVQRRFLELLVRRDALRFGDFQLKSGRRSPYFVNAGCFHRASDVLALGECYAELIERHCGDRVDVIFGPAYKGIPLAIGAAQAYARSSGREVGWCFDRKEAKTHGDAGEFVGAPLEGGARVVLVDDVLTAGTALRASLNKLASRDIQISAAVVSVDRQEAAEDGRRASAAIAEEYDVPVHSLITIGEAVDHLAEHEVDGRRYLDADQAQRIRQHIAGD